MPATEPVLGPNDDTLTFFQPRGMVFVTMLWVVAALWLVFYGLALLARIPLGEPPTAGELSTILEVLLIVPLVVTCLIMLVAWRRLGWLHTSVHGIEFAATGRRPVRLAWSAIGTVALRYRGPFTELVVTPSEPDLAEELPGPGRRARTRRRGTEVSYLVDVGLMSPGPQTLLSELHRRIPTKV